MKSWTLLSLLGVFVFVIPSRSHTVHLGRTCPAVQAFPNLSVDKILGLWYVVYQFDTSNTCMVWNLVKSETNPEQLLLTESRQISVLDAVGVDHKQSITARIDIPNPEVPSKMRIRWPTSLTGKADFIVFDTDYDNYLAIFQCDRAGLIHRRDTTILSRSPIIDDMFIKRVRRLLDTADVSHDALDQISHRECRSNTTRDWHIDGELFGLLPHDSRGQIKQLSTGVEDYDISQIEIIGDGVEGVKESFRGSLKNAKPSV